MSISRALRPRSFSSLAQVTAPEWRTVKFQQEDFEVVAAEVPEFNFYEFPEDQGVNPYRDAALSKDIYVEAAEVLPGDQKIEFSQLENGLKVVSCDKGGKVANLGLFVKGGARVENAQTRGLGHMIELMSYRSTAHLSHLRTAKTIETLGATATCEIGREHTLYRSDVLREYMPIVCPLLIGNVLFPRLLRWEVTAQHGNVEDKLNKLKSSPDAYVRELLHEVAFHNNTLGLSRFATPADLNKFEADTIREHMMKNFSPDKMVFVGVNVNHDDLTKWLMRTFVDYNAIPPSESPVETPRYTGGYRRIGAALPYCHIGISFNVEGGWGGSDALPLALLQQALNIAVQGSAPSASSFSHLYTDAGLVGVYGMVEPSEVGYWCAQMANLIKGMESSLSSSGLQLAKQQLKMSVAESYESGDSLVQELGQQVILGNKVADVDELHRLIDNISESEVSSAIRRALESKPSVAAYGNVNEVPHIDDIAALFH